MNYAVNTDETNNYTVNADAVSTNGASSVPTSSAEYDSSENDSSEYSGLEIAVIGIAGRFPGARSVDEFWQNLQQGVESISTLEDEQLLAQGVSPEALRDPSYVKVGGVVEGADLFDAAFFGFSPREAEILDPQQRLFLETAVEALETAGYDPERYPGSVGVFGGAGMNGYLLNLYSNAEVRDRVSPYELFVANDKDFLTTRVSYKLNLNGPSVDVQTACSSSLVAVHMAAQSLLSGECDMAIAGGVAISKQVGYRAQAGSIYSPDGHCRAFDAAAAGTVGGNGVGIVVLKRLEDAIAANDTIDAVIKGSAINNDGAQKVSYTAPSVEAQASVIQAAQAMAEVSPQSISYIEAHGTGTAMGDPIEMSALKQAFGSQSQSPQEHQEHRCAIGSVKTNIGHLDAAAGISGFIKTVLALKNQQIPATLHFQQPSPVIDFKNSPFYVNASLTEWSKTSGPQGEGVRRAGVSSFGIGGTNAHIVLEEAPQLTTQRSENEQSTDKQVTDKQEQSHLLVLSAKTQAALDIASINLTEFLDKGAKREVGVNLSDVAYTLQVGRKAFEYRRSIVCTSAAEAIKSLRIQASQKVSEQPSLVFLFSGQGSQYANMAKELYETQPVFQQAFKQCEEILKGENIDLVALLYSSKASESLYETANAQPALFAVEYALAQLWMHWGAEPVALLGHSLGEYVAACLAGVFDLETALKIVVRRGQLMQQMPAGAMLSVGLSAEAVADWLNDDLTLAVSNGPQLYAVSGSLEAIATLQSRLENNNISCRPIKTSHAFHSPMMEEAITPFVKALQQITLHPPTLPFISNVTGTWITAEEATSPGYWGRQMRQTVRFSEGVTTLLNLNDPLFLEVGPGNVLTTLAQQHLPSGQSQTGQSQTAINSLPHPKSAISDTTQMLTALGQLWSTGIDIRWESFQGEQNHRRIPLPTYPFERQRYWVDFVASAAAMPQDSSQQEQAAAVQLSPVQLSPDMADWFYTPSWERCVPTLKATDVTQRPCWLIFADSGKVGQKLAQLIEQTGQDVFVVQSGEAFEQAGYRQFSLNAEQPEGFKQLLEDLQLREKIPTEIVYLWGSETEGDAVEASDPFITLMNLLKTFSAVGNSRDNTLQVTVMTEAAYDVVGTETLNPQQAEIQGLIQVMGQEYPAVGARQIDWVRGDLTPKQMAKQLWRELQAAKPAAVVAYRGGRKNSDRHRWQQTYQPVSISETTPKTSVRLRKNGLYVIVGPDDTKGEDLLQSGLAHVWATQLKETYQAQIAFVDGTNADNLKQALQQIVTKSGPIHGVFVSSPMTNEKSAAPIALLQSHHWEYNRLSKKKVLQNLAIALADYKPDFCCVQSSLSSIIGGLGLAAYSGANHFIDAFVTQQNQQSSFPWFSINWDAITEETSAETAENGHAPDGHAPQASQRSWGDALANFALTPTEAWQVTERILTKAAPGQIIVSKGDLTARYQKWIKATPTQAAEQAEGDELKANELKGNNGEAASAEKNYSRPQLSTAYVAPRNETETTIAAIWQDLLKLEKIGIDDSFFDLGGHSLLAIQVISRLREAFPVDIEMRNLLFEAPTVAKIAAVIDKQLPQQSELDEMAALLAEVQTLSSEEVQTQLAGGDA
ncbi:MAG: beta-ketoacyl synthase N-terminal-like domain-containing protein [Cyanobacteria bacterium P01_D01_bin.105]